MSVTFANIWNKADEITRQTGPQTLVLLGAQDEYSMQAIKSASERGWIKPAIARLHKHIRLEQNEQMGVDTGDLEIISADNDIELVQKAAAYTLQHKGILMRGRVTVLDMMHALVMPKTNFTVQGKLMTHIGFFESHKFDRMILITDGGVIIKPKLEQKPMIVKNAVEAAHKIGIQCPKVAMLAAVEAVFFSMETSLDDAVIAKMADRGNFGDAVVDGPLSLDAALVEKAALEKKVRGEVAGKADILVVSRIEVGNGLYKALFMFGKARSAGVIVGGKAPVVMTSRSQNLDSKINSIAIAIICNSV